MRGYFGIGVFNIKNSINLGTLWRSAYQFNASFIFVIGKRYKRQASDTGNAIKHIPLYEYLNFEEFLNNMPKDCQLICIEQNEFSSSLYDFSHPERAIYLLGAEDYGLPTTITHNRKVIHIDTKRCLNVATTGSIVMYDRNFKRRIVC